MLILVALLTASALAAMPHSGLVRSAGQPIPGATVAATQGDRKLVTTTDEEGIYIFNHLAPGEWSLEVGMFDFLPARRTLAVGAEPTSLDWELELKPRERVAPSDAPPEGFRNVELQQAMDAPPPESPPLPSEVAENANEAFLVTGSMSRGLEAPKPEEAEAPLPMPPPVPSSAEAVPGAAPPPSMAALVKQAGGVKGKPAARAFSSRGARGSGRGKAAASFGNRRKRGAREGLRGSAFVTARNSLFDARPFSLTGQTLEKPSYSHYRYGYTAGGPLKLGRLLQSDRTFFYVSYSGVRSHNPYSAVSTLPSTVERGGDFSQSYTRGPVTIYDPSARLPFPGNLIPAARVSPAAAGLLAYVPAANQPGRVQNYQFATSILSDTNHLGVRLSQPLSRKHRLSFSYNRQTSVRERVQMYGFRDPTAGRGFNADLSWTLRLGAKANNNLRYSLNRSRSETVPFFAYKSDVAASLGIAGTSRDPINWGPPNLSFTNFGDLSDASPVLRRDQSSTLNEGLTLVRGKHNWTVGGEYKRQQLNSRTDQNARGSFNFSGLMTSGLDERSNPLPGTGFDFADFLLGFPQSGSLRFGTANTYFRATATSFYGQDDWRLRPNFSLNLGLRYEYFTPFHERYLRMANLDIAPGFAGVAVVTPGADGPWSGRVSEALIDPDRNNLAPRVGLAWRPLKKHHVTVRAGYGWYYNGSIYSQFATRLASQPPFANTAHQSTTAARPLTLQDGFPKSVTLITNTYAIDRFYRVGYAQTWNLAVQKEFRGGIVTELGYLGTKGTRLDIQRLPNRAAPGSPLTAEQRRQIGNAVGFTYESSEGSSIYHAAQFRLARRFKKGVSVNAMYTFSKSIDNASTFGGGGNVVAQNDQDLREERGLSSFDQRHLLNLSYVLTSPVGEGGAYIRARGWSGAILRDWTFSGGLTARSGLPFTARVLGNRSDSGGTGVVGSGRAEATGLAVDSGEGFFNLGAFTLPPAGRYGNAGRNTIPGPGLITMNLSFGRSFRLGGEHRRIDFRLESNNFTNHVSFAGLATVVNASNYGLPTAAAPMRVFNATLRFRF